MTGAAIMLIGLLTEALLGWPKPLFRAIGHPVTWIGKVIDLLDDWMNVEDADMGPRRTAGAAGRFSVANLSRSPSPMGKDGLRASSMLSFRRRDLYGV